MDGIKRCQPGFGADIPGLILRSAFFFLLIAYISHPGDFACVQNAGDTVISGAGAYIGIATMLMVLVIAAAYMLGMTTSNANAIVFAKDELFHLGFSIVLLLGIGGIMASGCLITNSMFSLTFKQSSDIYHYYSDCGGETADPTNLTVCAISMPLKASNSLIGTYTQYSINNMMQSNWFYTYALPFTDIVTTNAAAYRRTWSTENDMVLNTFIVPSYVSLKMQQILLGLFSQYSVELLLPVGFIFRFIPVFRKFGNFLLAMAFGFYIVLPFFATFNFFVYDHFANSPIPINGFKFADNSNGFYTISLLVSQAFFLPNLTIVLFITFLSGINKALGAIG